jgi:hypothetical protein
VAVRLPTGSVSSCNRERSESGVVHDHIRLCKDEIMAIARIVVAIGDRHMGDAGTA